MIAYHFPPIRHSSGIQRTLKFVQYLRRHDWHPVVLSVHPRAYETTGEDQLHEIPDDVPVYRAFALDTARHLALAGRHPFFLSNPDRWISWLPDAVRTGRQLIRRYRPDIIWSTYPIPTAHMIGQRLHDASGLPWVADFRDQMTEPDYPTDPRRRKRYLAIEQAAVHSCARAVFTTPGTLDMYRRRYPAIPVDRWALIPNGYDEENFVRAAGQVDLAGAGDGRLLLVHAGILYPSERDPQPFFRALAALKQRGAVSAAQLCVRLRATAHDRVYQPLLERLDIADIVELAPPVAYTEALAEMLRADGLLLFQAANCNRQVPAKLYEYLRAGRPILALTDAAGDTAATLREAGTGSVVPLDDAARIELGLADFIEGLGRGSLAPADADTAARYSRAAGARQLADIFDTIVAD